MSKLRFLGTKVEQIVSAEDKDTDAGNPTPVSTEGKSNQALWVATYHETETTLLAMLELYGVKVDAERDETGSHRFHANLITACENPEGPLHEAFERPTLAWTGGSVALRYIDNHRKWWNHLQSPGSQSTRPMIQLPNGQRLRYRKFYTMVFQGLVRALKICMDDHLLMGYYSKDGPIIRCKACGDNFDDFRCWRWHRDNHYAGKIRGPRLSMNPVRSYPNPCQ